MTQVLSPGVYTREIDLSQYAPQLSTSTLALVGIAKKGPVNTPTIITNELDWFNTFGTPDSTSYMLYAGQQYLRNGRSLIGLRITDGTEATATVAIDGAAQPAFFVGEKDLSGTVNLSVRNFVRISIDGVPNDVDLLAGYVGDNTRVPLEQIVSAINAIFAGSTAKDNYSRFPVIRGTTTGIAGEISILAYSDPLLDAGQLVFGLQSIPFTVNGIDAESPALTVSASSPGTFANGLQVDISNGTNTGTFKIVLKDIDGVTIIESYDNLTKENVEQRINGVSLNIVVDDETNDALPDPATLTGATPAAVSYLLQGGLDGISGITDADYIGTITNGEKTGLRALENIEEVPMNMVAVPGVSSGPVVLAMLELCSLRGDCMALVDPPSGLNFSDVIDYHNGAGVYDGLHPAFNSSFGAIYWPWVEFFDPITEERIISPPSGWVAGQIALTAFVSEPWFAPAGLTRGRLLQATRLENSQSSDLGIRDQLQAFGNNVNPIVDFSQYGITIYGQKTLLRTASALDRVNVRFLLNVAKKLVKTVAEILPFEPNDSVLWDRATNLINPILRNIASRRGIEPDFQVVFDETTTTSTLQNQNEMNGKIFITPIKSAEKITIDFIVLASGVQFSGDTA